MKNLIEGMVLIWGERSLLVFMVMNGEASDNEYGPDPKADASVAEA